MKNLLLTSTFFQEYGLLILLSVGLVFLIVLSFSRKKKEESFRGELLSQIKPGVKVKTYGGLYGKVISIEETTDGKIVLLESGVGKKVSYQQIHFNAIYGIDEKQPVVLDAEGNQIFPEDNLVKQPEVEKTEAVASVNEISEEEVVAEKPQVAETKKPTVKKARTKKSA